MTTETSLAQQKPETPLPGIHGVALDSQQIESLSVEALNGSGEAARRIALHYLMAQGNRKEGLFWSLIAAENGDAIGQYNAGSLLKDDPDPLNRQRASFWLKRAAEQGHEKAAELLKALK